MTIKYWIFYQPDNIVLFVIQPVQQFQVTERLRLFVSGMSLRPRAFKICSCICVLYVGLSLQCMCVNESFCVTGSDDGYVHL